MAQGEDAAEGEEPAQPLLRAVFISDLHLGTPGCQAQALLAFLRSHQSEHLYLVGDPDTDYGRNVLTALSSQPALAARVHSLGFRPDVPQLLPAFDAFALASRREALSIAVIEAFAAGLPVVATDVGGVPEIVRHEDTGLLVPTENANALAGGIHRLQADAPLRAHLVAQGGRLYREQLTAQSMLNHTLALYQRCLTSTR